MNPQSALRYSARCYRRGLTLLELLLVLAVLIVLTAVAWPSLSGLHHRQRLQQAAFTAQRQLASARVNAVRRGVPCEFRYEPGGRSYVVLQPQGIRPSDSRDAGPPFDPRQSFADQLDPIIVRGQLAEGISFATAFDRHQGVERTTLPANLGALLGKDLGGAFWSSPIRFYPDGSGTEAQLEVVDRAGRALRVSVRQLTGSVRVGPPR